MKRMLVVMLLLKIAVCQKLTMANTPRPDFVAPRSKVSSGFNRTVITVPALVQFGGFLSPLGPLCTEAMQVAVDNVYKHPSILPDYELRIQIIDDECSRPIHMQRIVQFMESSGPLQIPLVAGSTCAGTQHSGSVVKHYGFLGLAPQQSVNLLYRERRLYEGYYMQFPSVEALAPMLIEAWNQFGFRRIAILTETQGYYADIENLIEKLMPRYNQSIIGIGKVIFVPGIPVAPEDFARPIEELFDLKARILLINTNYGLHIACWLHRFGMVGPGYVFFMTGYFSIQAKPPYSWCTGSMLESIRQTAIFYWTGHLLSVSDELQDSLGTTAWEFTQHLVNRIENPQLTSAWNWWRMTCYDSAAGVAMWLNATEAKLKRQGETLANFTSRMKLRNLMKETIKSLEFQTLSGRFQLDEMTGGNKQGNIPMLMYQMHKTSKKTGRHGLPILDGWEQVPVFAMFNGKQIVPNPETLIQWGTRDNRPPLDSVQKVAEFQTMITTTTYAVLSVFAVFLIITSFTFMALPNRQQNVLYSFNRVQEFGHVLLLTHILVLPALTESTKETAQQCSISYGLVAVGCSFCFLSFAMKLELASRQYLSTKTIDCFMKAATIFILLIVVLLIVSFKGAGELIKASYVLISPEIASPVDISIFYVEYRMRCHMAAENGSARRLAEVLFGIIFAAYVLIIPRACSRCFRLKSSKLANVPDVRRTVVQFCVTTSGLLFAILVGGFILGNESEKMSLTFAIVSIITVFVNHAVMMLPVEVAEYVTPNLALTRQASAMTSHIHLSKTASRGLR